MSSEVMNEEASVIDEPQQTAPVIDEPQQTAAKSATSSAVIGVFDTHDQAERAIKALEAGGFPMRRLSIVGKGYQAEEKPTGFYTTGDRVKTWGGVGLLWGGLWGLLVGAGFFWIPGIGLIAAGGPFLHLLATAAGSAVVFGGASALGAALISLGLPKKDVIKYERLIKSDRYLVIAHGTPDEVARAAGLMEQERATETAVIGA
jgi:hypothetical protein